MPSMSQLAVGRRLMVSASKLLGYRYGRTPNWPEPLIPHLPQQFYTPTGPKRIDCSSMTAFLLLRSFQKAAWDDQSYGDLQVFADRFHAGRFFSPIEAVVRAGIGAAVERPTLDAWHLAQSWRETPIVGRVPPSGHAWLCYAYEYDQGGYKRVKLAILHSTSAPSQDGPGWKEEFLEPHPLDLGDKGCVLAENPGGVRFARLGAAPEAAAG